MGWALQEPGLGGKRHSPHVKDYLKVRFDAGEQSGQKNGFYFNILKKLFQKTFILQIPIF